jgi:hypothetical protein
MSDNPHQFTRDAWEANAEVWDARMGDDGNDFFKKRNNPSTVHLIDFAFFKEGMPLSVWQKNRFGSLNEFALHH